MLSAAALPRRFSGRSRSESFASCQRASACRINVSRFTGSSLGNPKNHASCRMARVSRRGQVLIFWGASFGRPLDEQAAILLAHAVGAQGLIGGRTEGFAGAQAEVREV